MSIIMKHELISKRVVVIKTSEYQSGNKAYRGDRGTVIKLFRYSNSDDIILVSVKLDGSHSVHGIWVEIGKVEFIDCNLDINNLDLNYIGDRWVYKPRRRIKHDDE